MEFHMELETSTPAAADAAELRAAMNGAENPAGVAWRLNFLANFYTGPLYRELEERWQLSRPQFVVLYCVRQVPGLLARDIVVLSGRPKNSISRAVNANLALGLIANGPTGEHGRRPLKLTDKGAALLAQVLPLFKQREADMLAVLSADEQRTFDALLRKMALRTDDWARPY
jgi:MarR family transcriptional regulator, temperature-dependent positive regulator of motility